MKYAKSFAVGLFFTTLFYNNCSGFKPVDGLSTITSSSTGGGGPAATPTPPIQLGVDPYPTPTPQPMGTPKSALPYTMPDPPTLPLPTIAAEFPKVASNFNVNDWIWEDDPDHNRNAYGAFEGVGAFRFICKPSHHLYDDPIVYPNQPGASHLHTFFGNTMTNANSTYQTLRSTGDGTCAGGPLNRSAYWHPALRLDDGDGNNDNDKIVVPDYTIVYYKMAPERAKMFNRGMRMIFGYNMSDPSKSSGFKWMCLPPQGVTTGAGDYPNLQALAAGGCPAGSQIEVLIGGPTCWNGQFDSPDHRSHMAHVGYGGWGFAACPPTHPYSFPSFTLGVTWTVGPNGPSEIAKMYLSSDRMPGMPNAIPGSTYHTDWFGAWDDDVLSEWMFHADADYRNCSAGVFGDGRGLKDPYAVTGKDGYKSLLDRANPRIVSPPARN